MYERILVPTDGSEHARRAAEHAFSIAETLDATVSVLGVADMYEAAGPFDAGGVSQEYVDRIAEDSRAHVDDIAEMADGVPVETHVEVGTPRKAILTFADEAVTDASDTAAVTNIVDHYESVGERATAEIERAGEDAGVDVVTAIEEGTSVDTLLAYTDDHDIDLVTMGTHGRDGLQRVILGSTTERAIRQSSVPVLSVRPTTDREE